MIDPRELLKGYHRILSRTENVGTDGCWTWTGAKLRTSDHGQCRVAGRAWLVHRLVFTVVNGPIPDGMVVMHKCDNPPCVNPDHLRLGTQLDNIADCKSKGRARNAHSRKTSCPKGHPYGGANLITRRNGTRACRACQNERRARQHARETPEQRAAINARRREQYRRRNPCPTVQAITTALEAADG